MRARDGHVALEMDQSEISCNTACRWNEYTMGKSEGKLESSQKQNCNILIHLSGIHKVLCPTFYLHTYTYSTMSVRCATELAVSVCTRFPICSCTGEGRQKTMAPTEAEPWTYTRTALCEVTNFNGLAACCSCPETANLSINQVA